MSSAINSGSATTLAEKTKVSQYESLIDRFIFVPFAVKTSGVIGPSSLNFITDIYWSFGGA